jgi:hypothetical protein
VRLFLRFSVDARSFGLDENELVRRCRTREKSQIFHTFFGFSLWDWRLEAISDRRSDQSDRSSPPHRSPTKPEKKKKKTVKNFDFFHALLSSL